MLNYKQRFSEGIKMEKIVLVSASTGERGQDGKKKVYEIVIDGNRVVMSWGKAEETRRQTKREWFTDNRFAKMFAEDKMYEKMNKGYALAFRA